MAPITDGDRGPAINVGIWTCLVAMSFGVLVKIYTKIASLRVLQMDDFLIIAAFVFGLADIISISEQVANGLGRHAFSMDASQMESFYKAAYATSIFYAITVLTTKLACLEYFISLAHSHRRRLVLKGTIVTVIVWTIISILVLIFQCQLPHPWLVEGNVCLSLTAFWTAFSVFDIISQIATTIFPVWLLYDLNTSTAKKRKVMIWFSPLILTVPVALVRLVYIFALSSTQDPTWDSFNVQLVSGIHASLAIITACVPFSKMMIESLAIGIISNDVRGLSIGPGLSNLTRSSLKKSSKSSRAPDGSRGSQRDRSGFWNFGALDRASRVVNVSATAAQADESEELQRLRPPDASADRMIIRCERSLTVSSETRTT